MSSREGEIETHSRPQVPGTNAQSVIRRTSSRLAERERRLTEIGKVDNSSACMQSEQPYGLRRHVGKRKRNYPASNIRETHADTVMNGEELFQEYRDGTIQISGQTGRRVRVRMSKTVQQHADINRQEEATSTCYTTKLT